MVDDHKEHVIDAVEPVTIPGELTGTPVTLDTSAETDHGQPARPPLDEHFSSSDVGSRDLEAPPNLAKPPMSLSGRDDDSHTGLGPVLKDARDGARILVARVEHKVRRLLGRPEADLPPGVINGSAKETGISEVAEPPTAPPARHPRQLGQ